MNNAKIIIPLFIVIALIQLYIPSSMIMSREEVLNEGKEFRFEAAPVDPADPFRGRYLTLRCKENSFPISGKDKWQRGEQIFVILEKNTDGFATIKDVSKDKPHSSEDYVIAKVRWVANDVNRRITITYPFDRYYMEESKAILAEKKYLKALEDKNTTTYLTVQIKDGEAVLKAVMINGQPIETLLE
ncbi:hypothetical protein EYV94_10175 [Puteibacter caeruleilacunae]|nr:hypothetical protein EYV94_10175 [Puteibacter caeruleilacunae]